MNEDENRMLTIAEAADFLNLHERTVRKMIAAGQIEVWRPFSHTVRVPYRALVELTKGAAADA
jgi:excisionase family DNA binding protein